MIDEYEIDVPKTAHDLIETSAELNHCVHSYANRIKKKKCQIINLKRDRNRVYTIEVVKNRDGFEIKQFRGKFNENSMEGFDGEKLRMEIIKLCKI